MKSSSHVIGAILKWEGRPFSSKATKLKGRWKPLENGGISEWKISPYIQKNTVKTLRKWWLVDIRENLMIWERQCPIKRMESKLQWEGSHAKLENGHNVNKLK